MMNFGEIIQQKTLKEIRQLEEKDLDAVEEIGNRLKAAYALTLRMEAAGNKLKQIPLDDLSAELHTKLTTAKKEADELVNGYRERLDLDIQTLEVLGGSGFSQHYADLQAQIESLFRQFEDRLRVLAQAHEKLSIEEVVKQSADNR